MMVRIPTDGKFVEIVSDVVGDALQMIVGLDQLHLYGEMVDVPKNRFIAKKGSWNLPLSRRNGHLYYQ